MLLGLHLEMASRSPTGEKACNGTYRYCKLKMINYSSCYATSRVCRAKRKSLGKWREKASAEELRGPSLHSAPGYFYAFYFPSNELFSFFSFPGATIICACPCGTRSTGQKARRGVGGH